MILILSLCKEKLHELEFVKPIEKIVKENHLVKSYKDITIGDLKKADKVILSGTSLKDFDYLGDLDNFLWIKDFDKPLLGICAGMQVLVHHLGGELSRDDRSIIEHIEIGINTVKFNKTFLGIPKGKSEVYSLHRLGVGEIGKNFDVYAKSDKDIQAVKHKSKDIYGVLFHPEVYNHEVIEEFAKL